MRTSIRLGLFIVCGLATSFFSNVSAQPEVGFDNPGTDYVKRLAAVMAEHFSTWKPLSQAQCRFKLFVADDGQIYNVRLSKSSGDLQLDSETLEYLLTVGPLPPRPISIRDGKLLDLEIMEPVQFPSAPRLAEETVEFFKLHADLVGKKVVLHRIPLAVLYKYPNLFRNEDLECQDNLRAVNSQAPNIELVLSAWSNFFSQHKNPTKENILEQANFADQFLYR